MESHYLPLTEAQYRQAVADVPGVRGNHDQPYHLHPQGADVPTPHSTCPSFTGPKYSSRRPERPRARQPHPTSTTVPYLTGQGPERCCRHA